MWRTRSDSCRFYRQRRNRAQTDERIFPHRTKIYFDRGAIGRLRFGRSNKKENAFRTSFLFVDLTFFCFQVVPLSFDGNILDWPKETIETFKRETLNKNVEIRFVAPDADFDDWFERFSFVFLFERQKKFSIFVWIDFFDQGLNFIWINIG